MVQPAGEEAALVQRLLVSRGETLAVAESLTGGMVAAELTAVPGASKVLRGSVTAYATEIKHSVLGVDGSLLAGRGAVDPEVARQMAVGVRRLLGADWGIATTGVAGPDPQDGQPVGTVYVAVAGPDEEVTEPDEPTGRPGPEHGKVAALRLNGDRTEIRMESVRSVLALLVSELTGNAGAQDTEQNGGN
ncbi:CinA family protein [Streptomyces sp. YC504]|uniref:CinA family protein n=1 Tax=Streptomyces mesophilus TaxID=1775132 RepID=A0A6G4XKS4_9ACTN|nr:CinA family protein [Streptomyces mesophilus]NGO78176.1 CinA family protein [Streptomyces mesophilus]